MAVVGCGAVGGVHLHCWKNLSGVRIVATCDVNGSAAAQAAAQYPGASAFQDYRALIKSQTFDVIDVCTSADAQFEVSRAALNSGANVLCESPFTLNADNAEALLRLAAARERVLIPAFCHRFHPPVLFAKDLIDNDELGKPTMFRCRFSGFWDDAASDPLAASVGALRSTAIHAIDLFRYLCGEVADVTGKLRITNPGLEVEDTAALLLEAKSGAIGVVETCWTSPGGRNVLELYGTAGSCIIDYDAGTLRYLTADQPVWRNRDEGGPNRFERLIANFADVVRGLQPAVAGAEDGAAAASLCDRVYKQCAAR